MKDKKNIEDIYPLSDNQLSFLLNHIRFVDKDQGRILVKAKLKGPLDETVFTSAWTAIIQKHGSLRTSIHWQNLAKSLQVVHKIITPDVRFLDGGHAADCNSVSAPLDQQPNHQLTVITDAEDQHTIYLFCHHIFIDGWSMSIVLEGFVSLYNDLISTNLYTAAATQTPQFKDYLNWLKTCDLDAARAYWLKDSACNQDRKNQPLAPSAGVDVCAYQQQLRLDKQTTTLLRSLSDLNKATVSEIVQAAWSIFLSQISKSSCLSYVLTLSGRSAPIAAIESIVGQLSTALPVQVQVSKQDKLFDVAGKIRAENNSLRNYDYLSLQQLGKWGYQQNNVPEIQVNNQTHIINSLIVIENFTAVSNSIVSDEALQLLSFESGIVSNYPLTLIVLTHANDVRLKLITRHIALPPVISQQLFNQFETLFSYVLKHVDQPVSDYPLTADINAVTETGMELVADEDAVAIPAGKHTYKPPQTETQNHLQKIWQDIFASNTKISIDADYFELGGTSLNVVSMYARIESRFDCNLPISSILKAPTIEKLAALISQPDDSLDQIIVPIQTQGEKLPIFGIHAQDVIFYRDISKALGDDQPFYALQQLDNDKADDFSHSSISQMASDYILEIKNIQENGPYTIIGLCMGCTIGHEIAHQLEISGEQVKALIMFDPDLPELVFARKVSQPRSFKTALTTQSLTNAMNELSHCLLKQRWFYQLALLKGKLRIARKSRAGLLEKRRAIRRHHNWQLNQKFKPHAFDGGILVIQSSEYHQAINRLFCNLQNDMDSSTKIKTEILEGSHTNIFSPPKVYTVATLITQYSSSVK